MHVELSSTGNYGRNPQRTFIRFLSDQLFRNSIYKAGETHLRQSCALLGIDLAYQTCEARFHGRNVLAEAQWLVLLQHCFCRKKFATEVLRGV